MTSTIITLFHFQATYLKKLLSSISNEVLYQKQHEGFNSPGWILGHFCIEAEDVLNHFKINYPPLDPTWSKWFKNGSGKIETDANLPSKEALLHVFDERYKLLIELYASLSDEQRLAPHPSNFMKNIVPDTDSWFAHHITTHISIHCGNIVVWKKMMGIEVGGY